MVKIKKEQLLNIPRNIVNKVKRPSVWGFFVGLAVIAVLSFAFFYPDNMLGNQLRQHDMQQGIANGQEVKAYVEATGAEQPRWTNSLFSGMPTFQISPSYPSNDLIRWINTLYGGFLPSPSNLLFMMMAGFLILMMAMKVRWYYALIGAIAWGFSTYFIIIIGAGHIWKFVTLAYIPPTIGGIIMAYRGRWLSGSALAALFAMMQIESNHVQMSYYFLMLIVVLVIAFLIQSIRQKRLWTWGKATGALALAAMLAVSANLPNLYNTYKYSKETMRGSHSELTSEQPAADSEKTSGLDRNYITQYSYGRTESLSLLIPNIKGGASAKPVGGHMEATSVAALDDAQDVMSQYQLNDIERQYVANYVSQYFGEPEGTNGPVYVGAVIFTLFLLGCFVVKGPVKWTMVILTLLSVLLALGRNLQGLTDFFIDFVPMYSRFRTVESILVIAEFTMPLLAILALQKVLTTPEGVKKYMPYIGISFGLTALVCALGWLAPSLFGTAISEGDLRMSEMISSQLTQAGYPAEAVSAFSINNPAIAGVVSKLRLDMVSADSLRSLIFIIVAFGALMCVYRFKLKPVYAAVIIGLVVLIDLYGVNKRYINHDSFCSESITTSEPFPLSANDRAILADTAMNYRVMDAQRFYQPDPSYHHKAIGGYHAAKLTRYQDLIDKHLIYLTSPQHASAADWRVLDMLNGKYYIDPEGRLSVNPNALGNAWFVDEIAYVETPDAEMAALDTIDPSRQAVADETFKEALGETVNPKSAGDTIYATSYAPDRLTYHAKTANGGLAVFSEVYFPWGWDLTIDGKPAAIGRVNYLLRAAQIPAGEHTLVMTFKPQSVSTTVRIARVAIYAIYLLLLAALVVSLTRNNADTEPMENGNENKPK